MSSIRHSASFRSLRRPELGLQSLESHTFLYDDKDLCALHGKFYMLSEMGGVQGLAAALRSDIHTGLHKDEVSTKNFAKRMSVYGDNVYPSKPLRGWFSFAYEIIQDPMLIVLLIASCVSVGAGEAQDQETGWYDGISIFLAVFLVVTIGATNSFLQERQFAAQDKSGDVDPVTVIRAGTTSQINPDDVQVGDIVQLSAGAFIPADGVLLAEDSIKVNESRMTGESVDVKKHFYEPFLFGGTEVREGQALMLVLAVGSKSAYGRILSSLHEEDDETPLQKKLERAATLIGYIGLAVAIIVFIIYIIEWSVMVAKSGKAKDSLALLLDYFIICVTIVVVAVPEGLPLAVTVSLAYSMQAMLEDQIMVRKLEACETMGNCTAICSDKTGTLTQNLMTVVRCFLAGRQYEEGIPSKHDIVDPVRTLLVECLAINSKAWVENERMDRKKKPEEWPWKEGNQTEISLLAWISKYDIDPNIERANYPVEKSFPFDSIAKQSSVIIQTSLNDRNYRRYYKGAAENILKNCTHWIDAQGVTHKIDAGRRDELSAIISRLTKQGLRTIGFSYTGYKSALARDDENNIIEPDISELDTVFIGCVGIADPLRPEARQSVLQCQRAGIVVRMVTGDHLDTASFIARDCGILTSDHHIAMTGEDFRRLVQNNREEELNEMIPRLRVLARSSPQDKEILVRWLKKKGHVVAATGDGTNDAPALHAADVGLAMYIAGTAVAKSAASVWIKDDNFASIVKAAMWGRCVYDNIRKFVQFQVTINIAALGLAFAGAVSRYDKPLGPVQLLWVNLIMDTFAALALGTEKPRMNLLERKPYRNDAPLISKIMWRNIILTAIYEMAVLFILLFGIELFFPCGGRDAQEVCTNSHYVEPYNVDMGSDANTSSDYHQRHTYRKHFTVVFNTFVFMQLFNAINSRKVNGEFNVYEKITSNKVYCAIIICSAGVQAILVQFGGDFIFCDPLDWAQWLVCLAFGAFTLVVGAGIRLITIPNSADEGQITMDPDTFKGAEFWKAANGESAMPRAQDSSVAVEMAELEAMAPKNQLKGVSVH